MSRLKLFSLLSRTSSIPGWLLYATRHPNIWAFRILAGSDAYSVSLLMGNLVQLHSIQ